MTEVAGATVAGAQIARRISGIDSHAGPVAISARSIVSTASVSSKSRPNLRPVICR
ncbi:MAG: hypothetical protein ACD_75C01255G0001 [uncultured bacterium]|nr:MAG: hypothetical protein ACD_75C01255G0001 [uncultured bacterium]